MTETEILSHAIFALQYQDTPEDADRVLAVAARRGLPAEHIDALRREWADDYHRRVQVVVGAA